MSERFAAAGLNQTAIVRKRAEHRRQTSRTVRGVRERMTSVTGTRPDFDHQLLTLFVTNNLTAAIAVPLVAFVAAIGVGYVTQPTIGIGWLVAVLAANTLFALVGKKFLSLDASEIDARSWAHKLSLLHLLQGCTWALMVVAVALNSTNSGEFVHVLLFASTVIMIAMAAMLSHALPLAAVAATAPMAVALSVHLGLKGDVLSFGMAGIVIGALVFFMLITQRMHRTTLTMLEARADKDVLIAELEQQRAIAEGARARAEEANSAKSRFLATMSHELRTPLNAILGFSEVMVTEVFGPLPNDHYRDYAKDIHNSGKHLLNLINEILDLSRIEAGHREMKEEAMVLAHTVQDCVHLLMMKAKAKGITINERIDETLPRLWADERAIRQITLNVLSNAVKFTPSGGEIRVRVGWTNDGGQFLAIRDTGPGIPEEEIPLVLSSFGQGSIAKKNTEEGTGLGLPIVQALVAMHGGTFDLKSKLREGTEVICTFPPVRVMEEMRPIGEARVRA